MQNGVFVRLLLTCLGTVGAAEKLRLIGGVGRICLRSGGVACRVSIGGTPLVSFAPRTGIWARRLEREPLPCL